MRSHFTSLLVFFLALHSSLFPAIGSSDSLCVSENAATCKSAGARGQRGVSLEAVIRNFRTWLMSNGAQGLDVMDSDVTVEVLPGNELGIVAAKNVHKGKVIFKIPRNLVISELEASREIVPHDESPWDITMAAWLLREKAKGEVSFWSPYINSLPSYISIPHIFDETILQQIDYPPVLDEVNGWKEYILLHFNKSKPEAIANATMKEFAWAISVVWSRSAIIEALPSNQSATLKPNKQQKEPASEELAAQGGETEEDGEEDAGSCANGGDEYDEDEGNDNDNDGDSIIPSPWSSFGNSWAKGDYGKRKEGDGGDDESGDSDNRLHALIPFFDLLNHAFEPELIWQQSEDYIEVSSSNNIGTGQKVHLSYFSYANDWFFLVFGFVPPENPFDKLVLFSTLPEIAGQAEKLLGLPAGSFKEGTDAYDKARNAMIAVEDQLEVLNEEMKNEKFADYAFEEDAGFWVWRDSHIEPRAFASAAALWLVHTHGNQSADVEELIELAHLSIGLGHFPGNITCANMAISATDFVWEASKFSLRVVRAQISSVLSNFKTTLEDDQALLENLNHRLSDYHHGDENDNNSAFLHDDALSKVIQFRMSKKKIAKDADARLWSLCPEELKSSI